MSRLHGATASKSSDKFLPSSSFIRAQGFSIPMMIQLGVASPFLSFVRFIWNLDLRDASVMLRQNWFLSTLLSCSAFAWGEMKLRSCDIEFSAWTCEWVCSCQTQLGWFWDWAYCLSKFIAQVYFSIHIPQLILLMAH